VGAGQPDIGEQRAEPGVGLDDALEMVVALVLGDVGGAAQQQRPSRRGPRQVAAPDPHHAGLARRDQERRRQRLYRAGRGILEEVADPRILRSAQRIPPVRPLIGPGGLDPVPDEAETERRIDVPAERRGARQRLAIAVAAHREHAVRRAVGPARGRSVRDEPVEPADQRIVLSCHPGAPWPATAPGYYRRTGNAAVIEPLPSRTVPRSAVSGFGILSGGKPAVIEPLPSRTVPRSAISGFGGVRVCVFRSINAIVISPRLPNG